ncbi:uncharacterized protein LOC120273199 [Dioscorea cayenensis subsp. rotundata]|uniref:Uncharacterized protein LOC120273199 n=1 Tax=Dioscorea cayennensis subsp. rotundata TaxID=55577 RepID=A0AB40CAD2_DIOCR|nr:uncharacterized protein LOC120273199 [Dioscorea cayenensis subsp. rotundata]
MCSWRDRKPVRSPNAQKIADRRIGRKMFFEGPLLAENHEPQGEALSALRTVGGESRLYRPLGGNGSGTGRKGKSRDVEVRSAPLTRLTCDCHSGILRPLGKKMAGGHWREIGVRSPRSAASCLRQRASRLRALRHLVTGPPPPAAPSPAPRRLAPGRCPPTPPPWPCPANRPPAHLGSCDPAAQWRLRALTASAARPVAYLNVSSAASTRPAPRAQRQILGPRGGGSGSSVVAAPEPASGVKWPSGKPYNSRRIGGAGRAGLKLASDLVLGLKRLK